MKLIDNMIIDQTPLADRFSKKYNNKMKTISLKNKMKKILSPRI